MAEASISHSEQTCLTLRERRHILNMTKAWKYISRVKDVKRYNERFPSNVKVNIYADHISSNDNKSFFEDVVEQESLKEETSHVAREVLKPQNLYNNKYFTDFTESPHKRISSLKGTDSLRSSASSIPEVIEECSSDDENDEDAETDYDYMHCINCSLNNSTTSLDSTISDPYIKKSMNNCYKCRHLVSSKDRLSIPTMLEYKRPLSWSPGDMIKMSPQRLRKSGSSANELPSITESFDEGDGKDEEKENKSDNNELVHFENSLNASRRRTISDELDAKNIRKKRFKNICRNFDYL